MYLETMVLFAVQSNANYRIFLLYRKAPEWKIRRFDPEEPNDDLEIVQDIEGCYLLLACWLDHMIFLIHIIVYVDFPTKNLASTPMSVVPKDVRIEIRADLKQLFTSSAVKCMSV